MVTSDMINKAGFPLISNKSSDRYHMLHLSHHDFWYVPGKFS